MDSRAGVAIGSDVDTGATAGVDVSTITNSEDTVEGDSGVGAVSGADDGAESVDEVAGTNVVRGVAVGVEVDVCVGMGVKVGNVVGVGASVAVDSGMGVGANVGAGAAATTTTATVATGGATGATGTLAGGTAVGSGVLMDPIIT